MLNTHYLVLYYSSKLIISIFSSTKLITYILPIYPFLACITAAILLNYEKPENSKNRVLTVLLAIMGIIFFAAGCVLPFAKQLLQNDFAQYTTVLLPFAPAMIIGGICITICSIKDLRKELFFAIVLFITVLSAVGVPAAFKFDYIFGQNDLMKFANRAKVQNETLASFGFGRRFSLNYYYQKHVIYEQFSLYDKLQNLLNDDNTVIVIKNINVEEYSKHADFKIIDQGVKYSLIKKGN